MDNLEIKSDGCGGFMIEPHIDTFSTKKIGEIRSWIGNMINTNGIYLGII